MVQPEEFAEAYYMQWMWLRRRRAGAISWSTEVVIGKFIVTSTVRVLYGAASGILLSR
jgi:hypothetical protein